ncbi:MAG: hypothetical protein H0U75_06555 [Legionella sp.]|nr:hypothetical protein [Legionella sp.]
MDQLIIQMTPSIVIKDGILEITKDGKLNFLDSNFKPLDCNLNFSFKNGQLHSYIDEDALNPKKHPCYLVKWGIFASVAVAAVITIGPQLLAAAQKEFTSG